MASADGEGAFVAVERLSFAPTDRVGVAVSGGPDSLAALALVARSCARRGVPVFALHVDHGLRARAAAADQATAERAARAVGATFVARRIDVLSARAKEGGSVEFVARILRHEALDRMAAGLRLTHLVLAHHRDDQTETVLLSLLRGAWPGALAGIPRERRLAGGTLLVRPFLDVPKEVLRAHSRGLDPADDAMNADEAYRRVAVRNGLLPRLRETDGGVDATILALGEAARVLDAASAARADAIAKSPGVVVEPGVALFPEDALRAESRFARSRLLRSLCDRDPSFGHATWPLFESLERAVWSDRPLQLDVRRGVRLTARDGLVALFTTAARSFPARRTAWTGAPAVLDLDGVRRLRIEPLAPGRAAPAGALSLRLSPEAAIEARPRQPRDRFVLGPQGSKLVADELSDRKVQPAWRPRVPLVFVDGELRWIPGVRVAWRTSEPPNAMIAIDGPVPWRP